MKIDRLIGILTTLQRQKMVTAPYLAEKFEVSRRTISRDIEALCMAGIPIVTAQGAGGGISIMEGFSLDTTVFTQKELAAIFIGLKSLDSVSRCPSSEALVQKLGGAAAVRLADHIMIDLSSFYKADLAPKIEQIESAVRKQRCIAFRYCYPKGEEDKFIEPYQIVFQWADWYVFGYCREREDFRMYKLRRMWNLKVAEEGFEFRAIPDERRNFGAHMRDDYVTSAFYDRTVKYRLVEEYGPDSFVEDGDHGLYAEWGFSDIERAVEWFLGFGDKVKVLGPPELVERMREMLAAIQNLYET